MDLAAPPLTPTTIMETPVMPGLGQDVWYTLTALDAQCITDRRRAAEQAATQWPHLIGPSGSDVDKGDLVAAKVVRIRSLDGPVSLQVFLDGNDAYWVERAEAGVGPGHWTWPDS